MAPITTFFVPALQLQFHEGGVFLPQLRLWLDPHEPQLGPERVFVSHAHSDHTELHREVILSAPTAKLMQARLGTQSIEHVLDFGQPRSFHGSAVDYTITLLPAGHIFGSAMSLIDMGGQSLLYTGDFKLRQSLSAEPCQPRHADVLIMETTYGRPEYRFPPAQEVMVGVVRFCRQALDNDETPVLLGYSLGKSQELLCGLGDAGLPFMLHGAVYKLTKIYEQFGQCFPPYEPYEAARAQGRVLLCPPSVAGSAMLRKLGRTRTAVMTGWAVDPGCRFRYGADAAFPLSDHADFPDLIEMVKRVNPKKIYTLHGFAADFAQSLREFGFDAQALSEEEQMLLALDSLSRKAADSRSSLSSAEKAAATGSGVSELHHEPLGRAEVSASPLLDLRASGEPVDSFETFPSLRLAANWKKCVCWPGICNPSSRHPFRLLLPGLPGRPSPRVKTRSCNSVGLHCAKQFVRWVASRQPTSTVST